MENKKINLKDVRYFINKKNNLLNSLSNSQAQIEYHKSMVKSTKERIEKHDDTCSHSLLLHLGKKEINGEDVGLAYCLTCNQKFYVTEEAKKEDYILDIDGIISPDYLCAYDGEENILVRRAQLKLISLSFTSYEISLEEIKAEILEDLVYFTDELEYRHINPRKRIRSISERK